MAWLSQNFRAAERVYRKPVTMRQFWDVFTQASLRPGAGDRNAASIIS